jgi:hypothetical protein
MESNPHSFQKEATLDALAAGGKWGGYDTNYDTKSLEGAIHVSQIIEKNGGDDGARTRDLCRDRA